MPELTITTIQSIREIAAKDWDALLEPDDAPFLRHAWLASLEDARCVVPDVGWLPQHVVIRRGDELVAVAPAYVKGNSEGEFVFDHGWARYAERVGKTYYPKLIVAIPFTPATGRRLLVAKGESRDEMEKLLAAAIAKVAEQLELSSAHVLFPTAREAEALASFGYLPRLGVQFHWRNRGYRTYDDFLASFNSKRRHQLKRERRVVEESGIATRTFRGKDIGQRELDAWEAFYLSTVERFYPWTKQYLNRTFFELVVERMPDAIEIVLAEESGEPIAGAFNVAGTKRLYGRHWGTKVERPFLHFHVCYYHGIEECIARGLEVFEPGAGGEHKLPRGFEPTLTHSAHVVRDLKLRRAVASALDEERRLVLAEVGTAGEE